MSSANETAEAILIVIKRLLKWILLSGVAIGVVIYLWVQTLEYWDWYTNGRHAEKVSIKFVKLLNGKECHKDYPYMYVVTNESTKIVEETNFTVELRNIGFSNVINSYTNITDSKILKPKETSINCFRATTSINSEVIREKEIDFSVNYKAVKFAK